MASGTGTMLVGDVFTIANVFKVHPETKANTGIPQQFTVTANNAGGAVAVAFSPAIVLGGARQNCVIPTTSATASLLPLGTASGALTIVAGTGWTLVGSATVAVTSSAQVLAYRTAANTYTLYRVA
jgi:hypothetical protein